VALRSELWILLGVDLGLRITNLSILSDWRIYLLRRLPLVRVQGNGYLVRATRRVGYVLPLYFTTIEEAEGAVAVLMMEEEVFGCVKHILWCFSF